MAGSSNLKLVYFTLVLTHLTASIGVEALPQLPRRGRGRGPLNPTTNPRSRAFKSAPAYRNQIVSSRAGKSVSIAGVDTISRALIHSNVLDF